MAKTKTGNGTNGQDIAIYNQDVSALVFTPTAEEIALKLAKGKMVAIVMSLEEGQAVEGRLIGPGAPVETKDPAGDVSTLATWRIEHPSGVTLDLISSHQLDKSFPELIGRQIFVQRQAQKLVGQRRINQFAIIDLGD